MTTITSRLRAIVDVLPAESAVTLPCATVRAWLAEDGAEGSKPSGPAIVAPDVTATWRERLWTCPEGTVLGVRELAEAVDRSADWVYRAVSEKWATERGRHPLPCAKLDGVLTFEAGAVRRWIKASSEIVNAEVPTRPALRATK